MLDAMIWTELVSGLYGKRVKGPFLFGNQIITKVGCFLRVKI